MKIKKFTRKMMVIAFLVVVAIGVSLLTQQVYSYNYDHVNVTTRVNITNSMPDILKVTVGNGDNASFPNTTLNAGSTRRMVCNVTVRDFNGHNDISNVNATLYYQSNLSHQIDDRNEHYTNTTCQKVNNDGLYTANFTCIFEMYYFANNGTWNCNATVNDTFGYVSSANNSTLINALYALNVTDVIDYGNLSVGEYSQNITANITNFGNRNINVSVTGWGRTIGDNISLVCALGTNISIQHERFYKQAADWATKLPLNASNQDMNLTISQQQDDNTPVVWTTYWQLYVPPNPFGVCNGTVRFMAKIP